MKPARQTRSTSSRSEHLDDARDRTRRGRDNLAAENDCFDARLARPVEPRGIRAVRDDDSDRARRAALSIASMID